MKNKKYNLRARISEKEKNMLDVLKDRHAISISTFMRNAIRKEYLRLEKLENDNS